MRTTQLSELMKSHRVRVVVLKNEPSLPYDQQDEWQKESNGYRLQLRHQRRVFSFDYWQGIGINTTPDEDQSGVLSNLLSDADLAGESFEMFCANCGYDTDSRKAERIYEACLSEKASLRRVFGSKLLSELLQAERD